MDTQTFAAWSTQSAGIQDWAHLRDPRVWCLLFDDEAGWAARERKGDNLLSATVVLAFAGLLVSVVSALENRVSWISAFCARFGDGCRRTQDFSLVRIPVSWWGIGYYAVLAAAIPLAPSWVFWLVMAGLGFELTFLWIMAVIRAFCIFCAFNAVVVAGLVWAVFDPERLWAGTTLALVLFLGSKVLLKWENQAEMAPPSKAHAEDVVAAVDGDLITRGEVERPLAQQIYRLKQRIYHLKRERLEEMIRARLLEMEAHRRGISKEALKEQVAREAGGSQGEAAQEACREDACPLPAQGASGESPDEKNKEDAVRRFAEALKEDHEVSVWLEKPLLPKARVPIEGRPFLGPADAPVVVVEFSDPFCPACRKAHATTRAVKASYADRVRWVFKDFPLEKHPGAKQAAAAAHCAGAQGEFWEYQDRLFEAEEAPLDADGLQSLAEALELDSRAFGQCLEEGRYHDQIAEDLADGQAVGIAATPTFIIDGEMISGAQPEEVFTEKIEAALAAAGDSADQGGKG